MTVQLLFKQLTKNIPTEKFWLGFVVRYWKTENSESIPCCEAIEITSLGLTLASENRERNGFSFPMPLWHRNRYPGPDTDTIIPRFYVGINDPDLIFPNYRIFDSVDFIFAAKEGKTLKELGGLTSVTAFSSKQPDGVCMDLFDSHYSAKAVKLPLIELNRSKRREFLRIEKLIEIDSYPGDIDLYCQQHAESLRKIDSPVTPTPTVEEELLIKGQNVELSKNAPELNQILIEVGWCAPHFTASGVSIDPTAFMLEVNGKVRGDGDFIYYNQKKSQCGSVELFDTEMPDPTGLAKAQFSILLADIPLDIHKVSVCLTIDASHPQEYYFGDVRNVYMRILNKHNSEALYLFELKEDYILGTEKTLILGDIYRYRNVWKYRAVGDGFLKGLEDLCPHYGVEV